MAGDWIKIEHTLPGKPEIDLLAVALSIDHDAVIGKLVRLWVWADQQMMDCNGVRVTDSFLDRLTNCPGFAAALVDVGWLASRNGRLALPNFDRHNGQTAKNRALTASRVKRSRNGDSVTEALPEKRREEKRREESPNGDSKNPLPPLPPEIDTPEFRAVIADWLAFKAERNERYKPVGLKAMLSRAKALAAEHGLQAVVVAIQRAMANRWQGWDQASSFTKGYANGQRPPASGQQFKPGLQLDGFR